MKAQNSSTAIGPSSRFAGWSAIASGVVGIIAFGFLIAALFGRISGGNEQDWERLIRTHDMGVILQSIFMVPVVFLFRPLDHLPSPGVSRATTMLGLLALSLIVLAVSLIFAHAVWDALYMIPQGLLGVWLIAVSQLGSTEMPRGLTRLGKVAGVGLVLVAAFPISYAIFVDPIGFHGPVPFDYVPPQATTANVIVHVVLLLGTVIGVAMYPIWSILFGRGLLRQLAMRLK
jgi:hypothetical protein